MPDATAAAIAARARSTSGGWSSSGPSSKPPRPIRDSATPLLPSWATRISPPPAVATIGTCGAQCTRWLDLHQPLDAAPLEAAGDHQPLDLRRALPDAVDAQLAPEALRRVAAHVA